MTWHVPWPALSCLLASSLARRDEACLPNPQDERASLAFDSALQAVKVRAAPKRALPIFSPFSLASQAAARFLGCSAAHHFWRLLPHCQALPHVPCRSRGAQELGHERAAAEPGAWLPPDMYLDVARIKAKRIYEGDFVVRDSATCS
jgi:hypothetical protein